MLAWPYVSLDALVRMRHICVLTPGFYEMMKLFPDFSYRAILLLSVLLIPFTGCGTADEPVQPPGAGDRVPACEVTISDEADLEQRESGAAYSSSQNPVQFPQLWQDGPFPTWSTTPELRCAQDPSTALIGDDDDVAVFITYPAAEQPTVTGDGRVAEGAWPLVVFAHANNDTQCNIYRRYRSLQRHWASWGFVVASVDGTRFNCMGGTKDNIQQRSLHQLRTVDLMKALNTDPNSRFFGRIDTSKVVFAGHSRGGGASLLSALEYPGAAGVITLQGIDITGYGFGNPPLNFPLLGITAGRDVDLDYPYVEPTEDQSHGPYIWVNINGAIHAWTADTVPIEPDDSPRITISQQHDITELYTTAFLAHFIGLPALDHEDFTTAELNAESILFTHEGSNAVHREISGLGVFQRWNRRLENSYLIDDYDRITPGTNRLGGSNTCVNLVRCEEVFTYQPDNYSPTSMYAKSRARLLQADRSGGRFHITLGNDGITVPTNATLQARVRGPDTMSVAQFEIEIVATSERLSVQGQDMIGPISLENRFTQLIVPLDSLQTGSTPGSVTLNEIIVHVRGGSLFIDDLRIVL